jgi:hypothetical protein
MSLHMYGLECGFCGSFVELDCRGRGCNLHSTRIVRTRPMHRDDTVNDSTAERIARPQVVQFSAKVSRGHVMHTHFKLEHDDYHYLK